MKFTVESFIYSVGSVRELIAWEFMIISNYINLSDNPTQLHRYFDDLQLEYFCAGFGSHHLWIKQRKLKNSSELFKDRLIFVDF